MTESKILMTSSGEAVPHGGYCKISDGTLIQWGAVTVPSGTYTQVLEFPIPFISQDKLTIQITPLATDTDWNINYQDTTTTHTVIGRKPNSSNSVYYWLAIGRWK